MSRYPTRPLRPATADDQAIVLAVIGVSTLARFGFAVGMDFGIDEAYAVAVSRSFQWSFFDHPPLAFWIVGGLQAVFGAHAPHWLLRLPFVLAFSGTLLIMHDLTRRLFGSRAALWAVTLLAVAPFFFASAGSWLVPDGPLVLFLSATALLLARILFGNLTSDEIAEGWLLTGVAFGLACLSKYHAVLFGVGALAFLLATPHRRLLARPHPWLAGVIALAIVSPVILWNADHGWISLAFQSGRAGAGGGLHPDHLLQTVAGQSLYLLPWIWLLLAYALLRVLTGRPGWLETSPAPIRPVAGLDHLGRQKALFLAALALPAILIFTLTPLFGNRGLPHWPMPGWLFVFPLAGAMAAGWEAGGSRWPARLAGLSAAAIALAAAVVLSLLNSTSIANAIVEQPAQELRDRFVSPLIAEAADWSGLGRALADKDLTPDAHRFVIALSWHEAARISEALGPSADVVVFDQDARGFAFITDQSRLLGRDAIVISRLKRITFIDETLAAYFDTAGRPKLMTIQVAGGLPVPLFVAKAKGFRKPFAWRYGLSPDPIK